MKDALGNRIDKGQLLHWRLNPVIKEMGLIMLVVDVDESSLVSRDGSAASEPSIVLQVRLPIATDPRVKDLILHDMLRVVNPAQEAVIDAAMGKMQ